jgi:hypothetical protein
VCGEKKTKRFEKLLNLKIKNTLNAQKMAEKLLQPHRILIDKLTQNIEELRIVQNQQPQGRPAIAIP